MRKISTAIASYGMSGIVFHGPLLEEHQGFVIKKILERHQNNSAGKHPSSVLVRDYSDILGDPDIELVIINTPDYLHYKMTKQALQAGKHVVVEKPFTLKYKEAEELIGLAEAKNRMLSVFQNRRWDGDFMTVKQVIKEGKLGRLVSFESHFDRFRNFIQNSWKENDAFGAGTLYNLGPHMIDQALVLFGMPEYLFSDVRALRTGSKIDDSFDISLYYENVKCFVRGSYLVKEAGPRYILHGTEGSFIKYGIDPQEDALKAGKIPGIPGWGADKEEEYGILSTGISGKDSRTSVATAPGDYLAYYSNIYEHLVSGAPLAVKAKEAANVIKIIEAAYKSASTGQTVKIL